MCVSSSVLIECGWAHSFKSLVKRLMVCSCGSYRLTYIVFQTDCCEWINDRHQWKIDYKEIVVCLFVISKKRRRNKDIVSQSITAPLDLLEVCSFPLFKSSTLSFLLSLFISRSVFAFERREPSKRNDYIIDLRKKEKEEETKRKKNKVHKLPKSKRTEFQRETIIVI